MIGAIILGIVAGFLGRLLMPGRDPMGFFATVLLGLAGALVGFFIFTGPLAIFVYVVLQLVALPLQNVVSRHLEAEADWSALRATHDPAAGTQLFQLFASETPDDPSPPWWDYVFLENHPTLLQRIEMNDY